MLVAKKEININNYNDGAIQVLWRLMQSVNVQDVYRIDRRKWLATPWSGRSWTMRRWSLVWFILKSMSRLIKDGSLSVEESGRDADRMQAMGKPTVEVIFTVLHARGKFNKVVIRHLEKSSRSGIFCCQCPSSWLEVEIPVMELSTSNAWRWETSINPSKRLALPQV